MSRTPTVPWLIFERHLTNCDGPFYFKIKSRTQKVYHFKAECEVEEGTDCCFYRIWEIAGREVIDELDDKIVVKMDQHTGSIQLNLADVTKVCFAYINTMERDLHG